MTNHSLCQGALGAAQGDSVEACRVRAQIELGFPCIGVRQFYLTYKLALGIVKQQDEIARLRRFKLHTDRAVAWVRAYGESSIQNKA